MRRHLLLAFLFLAAPVALTGCTSPQRDSRFQHEDLPECYEEARDMETRALDQLEKANRTRHQGRRREAMDISLSLLRDARLLYEDELVERPGTPEKQRFIEQEMDRLSDHIARVHRDRPAE